MIHPHLELPRDKIVQFSQKYPIRKLSLFGSVLRDDFRPDSDVDVLVEFEPGAVVTFIDMADMQFELEDILCRKVDLLTSDGLSKYFRQKVLDTAQVIFETG